MDRSKPRFKVGQVVRLDTEWYNTVRKEQKYQRITRRWKWVSRTASSRWLGWGYTFSNGDMAHEKWVKPLTKKEANGQK